MYTQNNLILHKGQDNIWYGVAIVHYVAISSNEPYRGRLVHHSSVNDCELSLAIYVQIKNISRKSCIRDNILP